MATQDKKRSRPRDKLGRVLPLGATAEARRKRRTQIAQAEAKVKEVRDRQADAYNLRLAGATYPQISAALGYDDYRHAHADVEAWRNEMAILRSGDELQEALDRNEALRRSLWTQAIGTVTKDGIVIPGDKAAILAVNEIDKRRAALLGLDSAEKRPTVFIPIGGGDEPVQIEGEVDVVLLQLAEPKRLKIVAEILLEDAPHALEHALRGVVIDAEGEVMPREDGDG